MPDQLLHFATFYAGDVAFLSNVIPFLTESLAAHEAVLVMAPKPHVELIERWFNGTSDRFTYLDMEDHGRNPARMISATQRFAQSHGEERIRVVGEPIWAGRSPAQIREGLRHEACINLILSDVAATCLCVYDSERLDSAVLDVADCNHSHIESDRGPIANSRFVDPLDFLDRPDPLPEPPATASVIEFHHRDLSGLRRSVEQRAVLDGVSPERVRDVLLAVTEVAANTLDHSGGPGVLRLWREASSFILEVTDGGHLSDPLVGRRAPAIDAVRGRGLWIVNQLSDLLQIDTNAHGSVVRMHFDAPRSVV